MSVIWRASLVWVAVAQGYVLPGVTDGLLHLSLSSDHTVFPSGLLASQWETQRLMETGKSRNLTVHEINSECWEMPCSPVCSGTRQSSQLFQLNRSTKQKRPVCPWIERTATALSSGSSTIATSTHRVLQK